VRFRAYDGQNAPLWKCLRECKLTLMPGELPRYQRVHIGCDRKILDVICCRDSHQERAGADDQSAISRTKLDKSSCDCWYHCRILCQRGHHKAAGAGHPFRQRVRLANCPRNQAPNQFGVAVRTAIGSRALPEPWSCAARPSLLDPASDAHPPVSAESMPSTCRERRRRSSGS
jgi:hypothetical protein